MDVDVLIPYRAGDEWRDRAFDKVVGLHRMSGRRVIVHDSPTDEWVKARPVWRAAKESTADVVVVADADVWSGGIPQAVAAVLAGAPWAIPHRTVHRLDRQSTAEVHAGQPFGGKTEQKPYIGIEGGGLVVLRRKDLLTYPLDPRFVGWGQEDYSWGLLLGHSLGAPWRGEADLWHLWHPPQPRLNRFIGSKESKALWALYRRPELLPQLVDEARSLLEAGP